MDVVAAARAFVSVSDNSSFTIGAAAIGVPQPVASRRVAALEDYLGQPLINRQRRRVTLTVFGTQMLRPARAILRAADALPFHAARAQARTVTVLLPEMGSGRPVAEFIAAAADAGVVMVPQVIAPADRSDLVRTQSSTVGIVAAALDIAEWSAPLGLAAARELPGTIFIGGLRPRRGASSAPSRIWFEPEDDVPHVRDKLIDLRDRIGLSPIQVAPADSLAAGTARALGPDDFLLCTPPHAKNLRLTWRPIGEIHLRRGYTLIASDPDLQQDLPLKLHVPFSRLLEESPQ